MQTLKAEISQNAKLIKKKARFKRDLSYTLLALPAILWFLIFHYLPISGILVAFKNYTHQGGIFGSEWVGFENFEYFFNSLDVFVVLRNTVFYHLATMTVTSLFGGMIIALLLYEVRGKNANKLYQTTMLLPNFISWIVVSYIVLLLLNPESGIINQFLGAVGVNGVDWYNEPGYWPFIIVSANTWKSIGISSMYFYAALLNIDTCLFEAADLDGAGKLRKIWHISVPELKPMAAIVLITQLGNILGSNFDLFYQLPMDSGALYPATNVLSTYLVRGLMNGSISTMAAVGLFQSVVGFVMILTTNAVIKKISPENALF